MMEDVVVKNISPLTFKIKLLATDCIDRLSFSFRVSQFILVK